MRRLLPIFLLLCGGCLWGGCASAGPKNIDEAMVYISQMREIAKEQGVSWSADIRWDGSPNVYEHTAFGISTGLGVTFHVQGNAKPSE